MDENVSKVYDTSTRKENDIGLTAESMFTSRSSGIEINKKLTSIKDSIEETKWFESRDPSPNVQPFLLDLLKAIAS